MISFCLGSLGLHFNPLCFAIANGETAEAYEWTYRAVTEALYAAFDLMIPICKCKVFPNAFNVDKVQDEEEETGPRPIWQPKIVGLPAPVTPPQAKKGKLRGEQKKKKAVCESDSDFEEEDVMQKKVGRRKLDLEARASSQPVL